MQDFLTTQTSAFWFIQAIGFMAFILSSASAQFRKQRVMFGICVVADVIWTVHYFMLGAFTAAFAVSVAVLRTWLGVFIIPRQRAYVVATSVVMVTVMCAYHYGGLWYNWLPALTTLLYGLSVYYHEDYIKSRVLLMSVMVLWILFGVMANSLAGVIHASISLCSLCLGYYRHRKYLPMV